MSRPKEPYTEYEGQVYEARISFCLKGDATEDQVAEWLAFELGAGSMSNDHPLIGAYAADVQVERVDASGFHRIVEWGAEAPDGSRSGRGRTVRERPMEAIDA